MTQAGDSQAHLEALHEQFAQFKLSGYWQRGGARPVEPSAALWRWAEIHGPLEAARTTVRLPEDTDQRVVGLANPGLGGATRPLSMAFQMLNPGETVDSHRHTATQMRFMVDGHGAYTTSDGEELYMEPGDLLVQPNWSWHGSTNHSDEPAIWVDAQDRNLTLYLGAFRRDGWAEGGVQPTTNPEGFYSRKFGMVRPNVAISGNTDPAEPIPPIRYRWGETLDALNEMADAGEHNPFDGVLLEYTNPVTGGHTVPTMSACIQMLRPGEETRTHRHTGTAIYHVVQGSGVSSVGGDDLAWERRDCFTVPPLQWHSHRNTSKEPAIMFSINDRPTLEALQLYHEEAR